MLELNYKITLSGVLLIISFFSGFWLSHLGRPLNTIVFTVHKLAAVGVIVFIVLYLYAPIRSAEFSMLMTIFFIIALVSILGILISGAFLSFGKEFPDLLLLVHRYLTVPFVISLSGLIYILLPGK